VKRRRRVAVVLVATATLAVFGATAPVAVAKSAPPWSNLQSVTVIVAQPGVPPPGGLPKTSEFATPEQVQLATAALNQFKIGVARRAKSPQGCVGGRTVRIVIVRKATPDSKTTVRAYLCADKQYGKAKGDIAGFLTELGLLS
jgi:hypothetical protein